MTLPQVKADLLRLCGLEEPNPTVYAFLGDLTALCINAALQEMYRECGGFFHAANPLTVAVSTSGNASFTLPLASQVLSVSVNGRPLKPLSQKTEVTTFAAAYGTFGAPIAFYVDRAVTGGGSITSTLRLVPPPSGNVSASVEVTATVPVYAAADLDDANITPPCPEGNVESFLLPLARLQMTRQRNFILKDKQAFYEADYERAILALRAMNPRSDLVTAETMPKQTENRG